MGIGTITATWTLQCLRLDVVATTGATHLPREIRLRRPRTQSQQLRMPIITPTAIFSLPEGSGLRASQKTIQCVVNASVSSRLRLKMRPAHVHAVGPGVGTVVQQRQMIEGRGRRRASALKLYLKILRYF